VNQKSIVSFAGIAAPASGRVDDKRTAREEQ
jgi:hypothetical protein